MATKLNVKTTLKAQQTSVATAGEYLTFCLGEEFYGMEILKVQEINEILEVTSVPKSPDFVRGVVNLRGQVIPVIDLRIKFEMETTEDSDRTCIIFVRVMSGDQEVTMGIIVDEVSEVLDIQDSQIEPPPALCFSAENNFIMGMGKMAEKVVMLLNVDKVLSSKEIETVSQVSEKTA